MNERKIYPESYYKVDKKMSNSKLCALQNHDGFVVGKVTRWSSTIQSMYVDLGNGFTGILPLEEISVYPVNYIDGLLSVGGYTLIGKTICASIISINGFKVYLSRKKNMQKAFEFLCTMEDPTVFSHILSVYPQSIYLDIGHGISGMLYVCNLTTSRLNHVSDIGLKKGDNITTRIISYDSDKYFINLTYKDLFKDLSSSYDIGDLIEVIVLTPINKIKDGYFAYVDPATSAIINPPSNNPTNEIEYGSKVIASVRNSNSGKLKLTFITYS